MPKQYKEKEEAGRSVKDDTKTDEQAVIAQALHEIKFWFDHPIKANPTFAKNQHQVIELIDLMWNSQYRDGDTDEQGRKTFFNIVDTPVWVATKMTDLDTKDIELLAENKAYWSVFFLRKELQIWIKEGYFAELLNEFTFNFAKYGHIIAKKVGDKVRNVHLSNIISDPTTKRLKDSTFVIEPHPYTATELRGEIEERGWDEDKVEHAISQFEDQNALEFIPVYERYDTLNKKMCIIVGEIEKYTEEADSKNKPSIEPDIIYEGDYDEFPYKEKKWEEIAHRWQGRGLVEKLFETQIFENEVINMFKSALKWTSKKIFQTPDRILDKNLASGVENGQIIKTKEGGVNPIPTEERNLQSYQFAAEKLADNTKSRTFSRDLVRGERQPSGTPLGATKLQAEMVSNFFDLKREDLGLFIKEILMDWILPELIKEKSEEHIFSLLNTDKDFEYLRKHLINGAVNQRVLEVIKSDGRIMDSREIQFIRETLTLKAKKKKLDITIVKGEYNDIKYKMNINITSENLDKEARLTTLTALLPLIQGGPGLYETIMKEILNLTGGLDPMEMDMDREMQSPLAAPPIPNAPQGLAEQQGEGGAITPSNNQPGSSAPSTTAGNPTEKTL